MTEGVDIDAVRRAWAARKRSRIAIARADPAEFNAYVLRDEETGQPIGLAPLHVEWHEMMTAHSRVIITTFPASGKTWQCTIGRSLWELGKNPNLRIGVASASSRLCKQVVSACAGLIERSAELHEVFPELLPTMHEKEPWTSSSLTVRRPVVSKDASIEVVMPGRQGQGHRFDLLFVDDLLDRISPPQSAPGSPRAYEL